MTVEENKARAREMVGSVVNTGNVALLDEALTPNFVRHDLGGMPDIVGPQAIKLAMTALRTAFPDIQITVEDVIAEGGKVVVRYTARGTHKATFQGIAATGRQVSWAGINIYQYEGGKVVETWQLMNALGLMRQLGVLPS